jgi:hypothetical protein
MKYLIKLAFFILINIFMIYGAFASEIPININITSKSPQDIYIKIEFRKLSMSENKGIVKTIAVPASTYNNSKKDYEATIFTKVVNIPSDYDVYQVCDAEAQSKNDFITETMHGNYNNSSYFGSTNNTKLIQTSDILFSQVDSSNVLSGVRIAEINLNITGCGNEKVKNIRIEHSSRVIDKPSSIWDICAIL